MLFRSLVFAEQADKFAPALAAVGATSTPVAKLLETKPGAALDAAFSRLTPDTVAKILFTSGSTGDPKGVLITHRNILSNLISPERIISRYVKWFRPVFPLRFLSLADVGQPKATVAARATVLATDTTDLDHLAHFQHAELGADRRVGGVAGQIRHDLGGRRSLPPEQAVHDLPLAAAKCVMCCRHSTRTLTKALSTVNKNC